MIFTYALTPVGYFFLRKDVYFHLMKNRAVDRAIAGTMGQWKVSKTATGGNNCNDVRERVDSLYRTESRRIFATLIRLLGDFDLAEEAVHDAFRAALEQWPRGGGCHAGRP